MAGIPAAALAGESVDPHLAWYAEWKALVDWCNAPGSTRGKDLNECPQWHRVLALEEMIATTPARTLAGARDQLRVLHYWTAESLPEEDMETAMTNVLATLERLAGEAGT